MKVVGNRIGKSDPVDDATRSQRFLNQINPHGFIPKGVYRFSSFKEADRWMIEQMASTHVFLKSKTC